MNDNRYFYYSGHASIETVQRAERIFVCSLYAMIQTLTINTKATKEDILKTPSWRQYILVNPSAEDVSFFTLQGKLIDLSCIKGLIDKAISTIAHNSSSISILLSEPQYDDLVKDIVRLWNYPD